MKVAMLQLESPDGEPFDERVNRVLASVAALPPVDLVVLPELWPVGYFHFADYGTYAQELAGELVEQFAALAAQKAINIHLGSLVERDTVGRIYNTGVLLSRTGTRVHTYRKMHVFGYHSREAELLSRGTEITVSTQSDLGPVSSTTCYDLRFPEMFRLILDQGAQLVIVPAAWPAARLAHWQLFTRARALENQFFVLACNAAGAQGGVELAGHSVVVAPTGEVVAEAGRGAELLVTDIDLGAVQAFRAEMPVLTDRRLALTYSVRTSPTAP